MMRILQWLGVAASVSALTACAGSGNAPVAQVPEPVLLGKPNPAAVYCRSQGGSSMPMLGPKGEFALCRLPDGSREEEWALYRRMHPIVAAH